MLFALNILLLWAIVLKEAPPIVSPPSSLLPDFHQVCLLFCKKYFINLLFCSDQIIEKNNAFSKQNSFFPSTYCSLVLVLLFSVYEFLRTFFKVLSIKLEIASYLHKCMAAYLASHQILEHNRGIHGHSLKITSCFFLFSEKIKLEVDTISII